VTTTETVHVAVRRSALPARSAGELLAAARVGLAEAADDPLGSAGLRYGAAHLAALRAAAAVVSAHADPSPGRHGRLPSVWDLLVVGAPEFAEWATYFTRLAEKRAASAAGIPGSVTDTDAGEAIRAATAFVEAVATHLEGTRP
jgi:hypothetical protein